MGPEESSKYIRHVEEWSTHSAPQREECHSYIILKRIVEASTTSFQSITHSGVPIPTRSTRDNAEREREREREWREHFARCVAEL